MGIRLYVGNLPFNVTEAELREHFSAVGPLSYLSIPTDRETGKQRGFAFLEFNDRAQADEAIRRFNNQSFQGRALSISEARARDDIRRPVAPARPAISHPPPAKEPQPTDSPTNKPSRNLGPDAPSRHGRNKSKNEFRSERGPKGPMREVVRGQFFGADDDYDDDDDDFDDYDDFDGDIDEAASDVGVSDPESDPESDPKKDT